MWSCIAVRTCTYPLGTLRSCVEMEPGRTLAGISSVDVSIARCVQLGFLSSYVEMEPGRILAETSSVDVCIVRSGSFLWRPFVTSNISDQCWSLTLQWWSLTPYTAMDQSPKVKVQTNALILDGWMIWWCILFQQYFSHIEMMEGWTWKALCNEALFRFVKKKSRLQRDSNPRPRDGGWPFMTPLRGRGQGHNDPLWMLGFCWPSSDEVSAVYF